MSTKGSPDGPARIDPSAWLDRYGDELYRHALVRVRRPDVAEDLVQETLLAALGARDGFAGQASEKTWLIGILKRKVVDHFRRAGRTPTGDSDAYAKEFFREDGHWSTHLRRWPSDPQDVLRDREFWEVFELCRSKLPSGVAAAFVLREVEHLDREDVCKALGVTASNLSVRIYRARQSLRRCLEQHWFVDER